MTAFVDHTFGRGFLLAEEHLRKLHSLLISRCAQLDPDCQPTYQVYRADNFTYTTQSIDDIVQEENTEWQRLTKLEGKIDIPDTLELSLVFDSDNNKTHLHIEGEDRDVVFLLFSDIRQYLTNEVMTVRNVTLIGAVLMAGLVALGAGLILGASVTSTLATTSLDIPENAALALETSSIEEKLDFLISVTLEENTGRTDARPSEIVGMVLIFTGVIVFAFRDEVTRTVERLYPKNIFLIGKEIERHEKRLRWRERIIWVIGIGIVVNIIAAVIYGLLAN